MGPCVPDSDASGVASTMSVVPTVESVPCCAVTFESIRDWSPAILSVNLRWIDCFLPGESCEVVPLMVAPV